MTVNNDNRYSVAQLVRICKIITNHNIDVCYKIAERFLKAFWVGSTSNGVDLFPETIVNYISLLNEIAQGNLSFHDGEFYPAKPIIFLTDDQIEKLFS